MSQESPYSLKNQMRLYFKVAGIALALFLGLTALLSVGWYYMDESSRQEIAALIDKAFKEKKDPGYLGGQDSDNHEEQPSYSPDLDQPIETGAEDRPVLDNDCVINGECG